MAATSFAPSSSRAAPQPAPPAAASADRIVAYLKASGPSPTVRIVQDLALSLDDAVQTLERLESFGFVSVDRSDGKATVTLSQ